MSSECEEATIKKDKKKLNERKCSENAVFC